MLPLPSLKGLFSHSHHLYYISQASSPAGPPLATKVFRIIGPAPAEEKQTEAKALGCGTGKSVFFQEP